MSVQTTDNLGVVESPSQLGAFLKVLRHRIPPETVMLGPWRRYPTRRGRRVTQEEIAEAVDVSRSWYRMLETGTRRGSMRLLDRLANALLLTPEERTKLFLLAVPELRHAPMRADLRSTLAGAMRELRQTGVAIECPILKALAELISLGRIDPGVFRESIK